MSEAFPGDEVLVSFGARDFDLEAMTSADVTSVSVTILDPLGGSVVSAAPMSYDSATGRWGYRWATPSDGGGITYRIEATMVALDASLTSVWSEYTIALPPTRHYLTPWCSETDIPRGRLTDSNGDTIIDVPIGQMIAAATDLLYVLSGRKYRSGRSVVRPTSIQQAYGNQSYLYPYSSMSGYGQAWGFASGWAWSAMGMGWWQSGQDLSEVVLQGPVLAINEVIVDGATLAPSAYTLYDGRRLVRNVDVTGSGSGAWPWDQQLALPITEPGTWQIDYEWGSVPPPSGRFACAELATELALSFSGQDSCRLPSRVLSVATQGVSVAVGDALTFLLEDLTGLPLCDIFLRAYNPRKRRRRSVFLGPNSVLLRSGSNPGAPAGYPTTTVIDGGTP